MCQLYDQSVWLVESDGPMGRGRKVPWPGQQCATPTKFPCLPIKIVWHSSRNNFVRLTHSPLRFDPASP